MVVVMVIAMVMDIAMTNCETLAVMEPWWNPTTELQVRKNAVLTCCLAVVLVQVAMLVNFRCRHTTVFTALDKHARYLIQSLVTIDATTVIVIASNCSSSSAVLIFVISGTHTPTYRLQNC